MTKLKKLTASDIARVINSKDKDIAIKGKINGSKKTYVITKR